MSKVTYRWRAYSDDGCFEDECTQDFKTEKEAYEDMRKAALEKMKWNTEYDEDYEDDIPIGYTVNFMFSKRKITHESYSGLYTYEIFDDSED